MEITERELESLIYDTARTQEGREFLRDRGLTIRGKLFRQFNLGTYGILDLATVYYSGRDESHAKNIDVDIYELKKGCIDINAVMQAYRYKKAIQEHFKVKPSINLNVRINLIGNSIETNGDFIFLAEYLDASFYSYKFDIKGLHFAYESMKYMKTCKGSPAKIDVDKSFVSAVFDKPYRTYLGNMDDELPF